MINNMKTGYSEADKRRIKIWRLMYRITETGHTVSITKEKFLNTYPPLIISLSLVMGRFFLLFQFACYIFHN